MKLVFVAGAGPGMGKTTLACDLAASLGGRHIEDADVIFETAQFAAVAASFRAGVHPSAGELEEAWRQLAGWIEEASAVVVIDGSFVDLAEDLDWALSGEAALHEHARTMRAVLEPVDPLLIFLDGDIEQGIHRRASQYGRGWFARQMVPGESWEAGVQRIAADLTARRLRLLAAFEAGGWELHVLDAGLPPDALSRAAQRLL